MPARPAFARAREGAIRQENVSRFAAAMRCVVGQPGLARPPVEQRAAGKGGQVEPAGGAEDLDAGRDHAGTRPFGECPIGVKIMR